jgi:hypothetical protein
VSSVAKPGRDFLRRLAGVDVGQGCVLSVYVNLDPSEFATGPARSSALTSAADAASRAIEERDHLSHETRIALRQDVERIRGYVGSADFEGTRGLAIYAAGHADLFEAVHLPHPVESSVVVDRVPHVAPLVGEPNGSWCVLLVNRRNARVLRGGPDELHEVERIDDDVPGQHDQGGWSKSRYERHIDEQARRHLKRVATVLAQRCQRGDFDHLLVGGPEDAYSEFLELLDHDPREHLRGRIAVDVENTTPAQVAEAAAGPMRDHERRRQDELLARLQEGLGKGGRAAAGLDGVLDCLNEQRVETLLLDATFESAGAHCPSCGWLTARDSGACPADGTELQPCGDVVEPAIHRTLAQDADVIRLRDRPEMKLHRGIAALLRF